MGIIIPFEKLSKTITEAEAYDYVLQMAKEFKFPATSFLSGSFGHTILKIQANILSIISNSIYYLAQQRYLPTSTSDSLTKNAENDFRVTRKPESQTVIRVLLSTEGAIANTYPAENVKIKIGNIEFYNIEDFDITDTGTVYVKFASVEAGADTRVSAGTIPVFTSNSIGNCTFQLIDTSGYFLTIENGQDEESDEDLRERCTTKWGTLSPNVPVLGYKNYIINTINPSTNDYIDITKVKIDRSDAQGIGRIYIWCGSDTDIASVEDCALAQQTVNIYRDLCATVFVMQSNPIDIYYNISIVCNGSAESDDTILKNNITDIISKYFAEIDIGGLQLVTSDDSNGYVFWSEISQRIMELPGLVSCICSSAVAINAAEVTVYNDIALRVNDQARMYSFDGSYIQPDYITITRIQ